MKNTYTISIKLTLSRVCIWILLLLNQHIPISAQDKEIMPLPATNAAFSNYTPQQTDSFMKKLFVHVSPRNMDSALTVFKNIETHCATAHYTRSRADALFFTGMIYTAYKQEPENGIQYFRESRKYYERIRPHDSSWVMDWLNNMGVSFYRAGYNDSAISYYEQALTWALRQKKFYPGTEITAYNNLGTLFMDMHDYDKSLYYLRKAEQAAADQNNQSYLIATWQDIAGCYAYKGIYDTALVYVKKIDGLPVEMDAVKKETQHNLEGFIYSNLQMQDKAIEQYKLALAVNPYSSKKTTYLSNLGSSYIELKQYKKAEQYLKRALDLAWEQKLAEKDNSKPLMHNLYAALANLYDSMQNYKQAYHYRTLEGYMADSMHSVENNQTIHKIETQYRLAEKDKKLAEEQLRLLNAVQITKNRNIWLIAIGSGALLLSLGFTALLLRQRLKLQKAYSKEQALKIEKLQAAMEAEERERDRIGKQLHDEVMVGFSIVKMNMAALQENQYSVRALAAYQEIRQQLDTACLQLRQAAHNLMPDALMDEGLVMAIDYFCSKVQQNTGINISFQQYGDIPEPPTDKAIGIYRILQELVQNVIKHAHAEKILVQISHYQNQMDITVEDNGIGIIETAHDDMGLKSIRVRLQVLNGDIDIHTIKPHGTSVHITIATEAWT